MSHRLFIVFVLFSFLIQVVIPPIIQASEFEKNKVTIAILDFLNTSNKHDLDYLQKAIPEALITKMAQMGDLDIVERSRLQDALKELNLSLTGVVEKEQAAQLGKAVGAKAILVGSYLEIGGLIRINARLIDVSTSKVLKAEVVQGKVGREIFDLMDQLAEAIHSELVGKAETKKVEPQKTETPKPLVQKEEKSKEPETQPNKKATVPPSRKGNKRGLYLVGGAVLIGGGVAAALLLGKKSGGNKGGGIENVSIQIIVPLQ